MLNELEIAGVSLKNPVFDYLQQDDADGNIESRLKTMVGGGMFGVIAEPAMAVFSTTLMASLRFLRIAKKEAGLASRQDPINNELNVYSNGLEGEASLERINNDSVRYVLDNPVIKQWLINNDYEGHWYKAIDSVGPEAPVREELVGASDGTDFVGPPAARSHIRVYEPTGKLVVAPPEDIFTTYMKLGDPKEGIISKQAIEDYRSGKIALDEFLGEVNFARLSEDGGVQEIVKTFNEFMLDTPQFSKAFDDGRNFIEPIDINKLIEIDRINGTRLAET